MIELVFLHVAHECEVVIDHSSSLEPVSNGLSRTSCPVQSYGELSDSSEKAKGNARSLQQNSAHSGDRRGCLTDWHISKNQYKRNHRARKHEDQDSFVCGHRR